MLKRLKTNLRLKPRTKAKRRERIRAIRKSWEDIDDLNVRPTQCQQSAKRFQKEVDTEIFNETLAVMISIFTMAEGLGLRMKNSTTGVEPLPIEKPKPEPPKPNLKLPKRVRLRLKKATSEH